MWTFYIISVIICLVSIYLLKNSKKKESKWEWNQKNRYERTEVVTITPILKVWSLALFLLGALVPVANLIIGSVTIICWAISVYGDKDWVCSLKLVDKLANFLSKPIE